MKAEIRIAPHKALKGHQVAEIWYGGEFIGEICGADGPGVRFVSKFIKLTNTPVIETLYTPGCGIVEITIARRPL